MPFKIPDRHKAAFNTWLRLDGRLAERFAAAVHGAAPQLLFSDFVAEVTAACPELEAGQARELLDMFFSMSVTFRRLPEDDLDKFLGEVFAQIAGDDDGLVNVWNDRAAQTSQVLSAPAMEVTAKAMLVMIEHDRVFSSARVFSELRPVFADSSLTPKAFVGVHQLKLEFQRNISQESQREAIFVAMDRTDLMSLRDVIDRAIAKHDALREVASASKLPLLEVDES
jgi:hypothetical protein